MPDGTFSTILSVLMVAVSGALVALLKVYAPGFLTALQQNASANQTAVDASRYDSAVKTSAGAVQTSLDQQKLSVTNVAVSDPAIASEAQQLIARIPDVVNRLGKTPQMAAKAIVGAVDTSPARQQPVKVASIGTVR